MTRRRRQADLAKTPRQGPILLTRIAHYQPSQIVRHCLRHGVVCTRSTHRAYGDKARSNLPQTRSLLCIFDLHNTKKSIDMLEMLGLSQPYGNAISDEKGQQGGVTSTHCTTKSRLTEIPLMEEVTEHYKERFMKGVGRKNI